MSTSFTKKILRISITLGQGTFGEDGGSNTKVIEGLRTECEIEKCGSPSKGKCKLKIYGMLEQDMNLLTRLSFNARAFRKNRVVVEAGDASGLVTAFQGEVTAAYAKYRSPPNLYFQIEAIEGFFASIKPIAPKSYKGATPIATVMAAIAEENGYDFENNGVSTMLASPYLPGSSLSQAAALAEAAGIDFGVDDGVLFIAKRTGCRGTKVPEISASTGMEECPTFDSKGIHVECLYNPAIKLGGLIHITSRVPNACGTWKVNSLTHSLSCESPGGKWQSNIKAAAALNAPASTSTPDTGDTE